MRRLLVSHQAVVAGDPEVDPRPHLERVGAIGIQGRAIAAQAVGHTEGSTIESLEAGLLHRLQGAAAVVVAHHRRQAQEPCVEIAAELIGHHHRRAALGINVVVLAVPEQLVEIAPGLLQPTAEFPLLSGGVQPGAELKRLGNGQGCLKRSNPEGTAVGTHPFEGPVVEGLIRSTAVVGQAVVVHVERFEVAQRLHGRRPAIGEEADVFTTGGELERAPHLQHKITAEVLPEVAVLIGGVVGRIPGDLVGSPQVVGGGSFHLAVSLHPALALGEVPTDRALGGICGRNRPGKAAQHGLVEFRPELQQGQGSVETNVKTFVPGVVEALENAEAAVGILR